MGMKFNCPYCGERLEIEEKIRDVILNCPVCGQRIKIPLVRKSQASEGYKGRIFLTVFLLAIFAGGYFFYRESLKRSVISEETIERVSPDESETKIDIEVLEKQETVGQGVLTGKLNQSDNMQNESKKICEGDDGLKKIEEIPIRLTEDKKSRQKLVSEDGRHYIWLEAEDADLIEPSFEVDFDEECSGGSFLSHPEDTGSSWAKNKEDGKDVPCGVGRADYRIEIPCDGEWYLWGRVKWETGCSDCFDVFIDDKKPRRRGDVFIASQFDNEMFGKNNTLESWHWVSSQVFDLKAGEHVLSLRNHDDGSHIDRILLTNDKVFRPQGLGDCHIRLGKDFTERIHKGENFYLAWFIDMEMKSGKWLASKDRLYPDEKNTELRTLILDGEDWWSDYQLNFLFDPPVSRRAGAVFYYCDEKNFYELGFELGNVELVKVVDGVRSVLMRKKISAENAEIKLRKENKMRMRQACINRFGDEIEVFIDGARLFNLKDEGLNCGKIGFFSERSKGFAIDDYEVSSIWCLLKETSNERIEWFCNRKVRVFNSVLDSFGATGGFHPGDYRGNRKEIQLGALERCLSGAEIKDEAKLIDWLWLSFEKDIFREKYGLSKGAGYIIAQSLKEEREAFLWTPVVLYGDWDFEFKLCGEAKELNFHLIDASKAGEKSFRKSISIKNVLESSPVGGDEWEKIRISAKESILNIFRDGKKVYEENGKIPVVDLRTAISMKGGTVFLDTAVINLYPTLYYDFRYNTPWALALTDWSLDGISRIHHGGGYYNFLILSPEKNAKRKFAKIATKRFFYGDFASMFEVDLEESLEKEAFKQLSVGFIDESGVEERIELSRNKVIRFDRIKKEEIGALENFSTERRRLTQLFFSVRGGNLILYLNDEKGTMRPVECGRFANLRKKFRLVLRGDPELRISRVLIWGEEK